MWIVSRFNEKLPYLSEIPLASNKRKIKIDSSTKSTLFAITLNAITLGVLVLIPKMKAAINPMSIIENKIMLIYKLSFGNNLAMKKTNSVAISKETVKMIGLTVFLFSNISPSFPFN